MGHSTSRTLFQSLGTSPVHSALYHTLCPATAYQYVAWSFWLTMPNQQQLRSEVPTPQVYWQQSYGSWSREFPRTGWTSEWSIPDLPNPLDWSEFHSICNTRACSPLFPFHGGAKRRLVSSGATHFLSMYSLALIPVGLISIPVAQRGAGTHAFMPLHLCIRIHFIPVLQYVSCTAQ